MVGVGEVRSNVNFDISTNRYEGLIAGQVEGDGVPLKGIRVELDINTWVYNSRPNDQDALEPSDKHSPNTNIIYTYTDEQGKYSFQGLLDGNYRVLFRDPLATYATLYYTGSLAINDSTVLQIQSGTHFENVNISLPRAGAISGNVRLVTSRPVSDATIAIWWNNGKYWQPLPTTYHTDQNGNYVATGLPPATYLVYVTSRQPLYNFPYIYEDYYGTATSRIEDAVPVIVNSGETTAHIDVVYGPDGLLWLPLVRKQN